MNKKKVPSKKKVNVNTKYSESPIDPSVYSVQDLITGQSNPYPLSYIETLFQDLVEWAVKDDNARKISQFITMKRIDSTTFYDWCNKFPWAKRAQNEAMRIMGDRRELGWIDKKYDAAAIAKSMHYYDKEWIGINKYHADLKKSEESNKNQSIVINMAPAPVSDMVPEREITAPEDSDGRLALEEYEEEQREVRTPEEVARKAKINRHAIKGRSL